MPSPTSKYSTDLPVYNMINKLLDNYPPLCKMNPNYITTLNLFVSILICHNFYYHKSVKGLVALALINRVLDILDGSVARSCNKTSKFGEKLDIFGDAFNVTSVCLIILYMIHSKKTILKNPKHKIMLQVFCIGVILYYIVQVFYPLVVGSYSTQKLFENNFESFVNSHSILLGVLVAYYLKIIVHKSLKK